MGSSMEFGKCSFSRLRDPHSGYASIELFPNPIQLKNNLNLSRFASFCGKPGMAMPPLLSCMERRGNSCTAVPIWLIWHGPWMASGPAEPGIGCVRPSFTRINVCGSQ